MKEKVGSARKDRVRKLYNDVVNILKYSNKDFITISFPTSHRERSIDVITYSDEKTVNMVVRVKDRSFVSKDEVKDLVKASLAFNAVPLVVSEDQQVYDNIVFEREGVYVLNERTLNNLLSNREELITLYKKGELYLKVDKDKFLESRLKRNLSLNALAYLTNISRKTLEAYEKRGGNVTIETAEKLVAVLGEDVIKAVTLEYIHEDFKEKQQETLIDLTPKLQETIRKGLEKVVDLNRSEVRVYDLRKSAPDYLIRNDELIATVNAVDFSRYGLKEITIKILECLKLSELTDAEVSVLVDKDKAHMLEESLSALGKSSKIELIKL
ncbi:MAG: hypothetical protein B7O98_02390 [Zestosphaera tikiterensis]|uniref:Putative HTH-type transcriptional regulatory protein B7O98_02390 n=1 Tax=Zestosphaera tikiterensis TaxID=1973259 RepID=A0A2R7Y6Z7_9CREN|nr:MAG: hypothetical protein B7O98_02390 [Zestosphaera tikiterensis]